MSQHDEYSGSIVMHVLTYSTACVCFSRARHDHRQNGSVRGALLLDVVHDVLETRMVRRTGKSGGTRVQAEAIFADTLVILVRSTKLLLYGSCFSSVQSIAALIRSGLHSRFRDKLLGIRFQMCVCVPCSSTGVDVFGHVHPSGVTEHRADANTW